MREHPGRSLDPSRIGRLVEREVATMLEAAEAEADRIGSQAMVVVRAAEAKIAALQLDLDAAVAELRELADRAERTTSAVGAPAPPEPSLTAEPPLAAAPSAAPDPPTTSRPAGSELPAVLTEPPAAMQRMADAGRPSIDIPASDEVVRLLREHMT